MPVLSQGSVATSVVSSHGLWTEERRKTLQGLGLITVAGTSAVDRVAFIDCFRRQFPATNFLAMVTTRQALSTDRPDEFKYLSKIRSSREILETAEYTVQSQSRQSQFVDLGASRGFAWEFTKRDARYGVPLPAFRDVMFNSFWPSICQLDIKCAAPMCAALEQLGVSAKRVCMLFIKTPLHRITEELKVEQKRNPDFTSVCMQKRLRACGVEEHHAMHSGYPYHLFHHKTDAPHDMMVWFSQVLDQIAG